MLKRSRCALFWGLFLRGVFIQSPKFILYYNFGRKVMGLALKFTGGEDSRIQVTLSKGLVMRDWLLCRKI